ncbi:hypothetical protein FDECE_15873 [Fusarium decemcellulare]|nr:hypothetical protein FDECE_15873 [Fusarium decemcellulare]
MGSPSTSFNRVNSHQLRLDDTPMPSVSDCAKALDVQDIRRAVPSHCFNPSPCLSLFYILSDISTTAFLFGLSIYIPHIDSLLIRWALWITYGFVQGLVFTGIWILAHECGHQALFNSRLSNDCVGFILHSLLLVPFFSWKYSHSRHHRYTNHMERDTAFVPTVGEESTWRWRVALSLGVAEDSPILALIFLVAHQLLGWPLYLLFYVTSGQDGTQTGRNGLLMSHFNPWSGIFSSKEQPYILMSNLGLIGALFTIWRVAQSMGYSFVFLAYGIPYLWVNHWIGELVSASLFWLDFNNNSGDYFFASHAQVFAPLQAIKMDFSRWCTIYSR